MFLLVVGALAGSGSDHKRDTSGTAGVDIENFGQVNDHIYRGGQPKGDNSGSWRQSGSRRSSI
jgi:hypothetical protein